MYCGSGTDVTRARRASGQQRATGGHANDVTAVMSEIRLVNRRTFARRTILTNFIPIRFETTEPWVLL